jgi:hypothetical protein
MVEECLDIGQEIIDDIYDQPWNSGRHTLASVANWQAIKKMCR